MHKHILIPTDGSDLSYEAIQYATALAKATNARITGVTVSTPFDRCFFVQVIIEMCDMPSNNGTCDGQIDRAAVANPHHLDVFTSIEEPSLEVIYTRYFQNAAPIRQLRSPDVTYADH